jgi:hypothetical protein
MTKYTFILIFGIFIYIVFSQYRYREKFKKENFIGVCLFDVDDTLTLGTDNYNVVQKCLDAGYAVGISTANPFYTPNTIKYYKWMPQNLYNFMVEHRFDTFNNVSTFYLNGKIQKNVYQSHPPVRDINILGWRKGISLVLTANLYGITDPNKMILFDDNKGYLSGILSYNNKVKAICSGPDCGGSLNIKTVSFALQN